MIGEAQPEDISMILGTQVESEFLTRWDLSKPTETWKNTKRTGAEESAILLKSMGTISLEIRDDIFRHRREYCNINAKHQLQTVTT